LFANNTADYNTDNDANCDISNDAVNIAVHDAINDAVCTLATENIDKLGDVRNTRVGLSHFGDFPLSFVLGLVSPN